MTSKYHRLVHFCLCRRVSASSPLLRLAAEARPAAAAAAEAATAAAAAAPVVVEAVGGLWRLVEFMLKVRAWFSNSNSSLRSSLHVKVVDVNSVPAPLLLFELVVLVTRPWLLRMLLLFCDLLGMVRKVSLLRA